VAAFVSLDSGVHANFNEAQTSSFFHNEVVIPEHMQRWRRNLSVKERKKTCVKRLESADKDAEFEGRLWGLPIDQERGVQVRSLQQSAKQSGERSTLAESEDPIELLFDQQLFNVLQTFFGAVIDRLIVVSPPPGSGHKI